MIFTSRVAPLIPAGTLEIISCSSRAQITQNGYNQGGGEHINPSLGCTYAHPCSSFNPIRRHNQAQCRRFLSGLARFVPIERSVRGPLIVDWFFFGEGALWCFLMRRPSEIYTHNSRSASVAGSRRWTSDPHSLSPFHPSAPQRFVVSNGEEGNGRWRVKWKMLTDSPLQTLMRETDAVVAVKRGAFFLIYAQSRSWKQ